MISLALIIILLFGWMIYSNLIDKFDLIESLGLSILLGLGATSFLQFLLSVSGIGITKTSLIVSWLIMILALLGYLLLNWRKDNSSLNNLSLKNFEIGTINIVWLALCGVLIFTLYAISAKSLFWITFANDSVTSFDLYAKAIAGEGKLLNSLIDNQGVGFGAAYPPLYSLLLSIPLLFGAETSKIIPVLFFIGMVLSFYGILRSATNSTTAMLFTVLMTVTPEMLAQSAINITNGAQSALAGIGVISLVLWIKSNKDGYLWISMLLMAMNGFTRSEGIVYILPSILVVFLWLYKKSDWKTIGFYAVGSLLPFIIWQIFLKINHELMDPFSQIDLHLTPQFDMDKLNEIYTITKFNLSQRTYYGITIIAFIITILANVYYTIKKKDNWSLLFITLAALVGYCLLLNQIELRSDTISNVVKYSGKRFLFGIIILMWFYIASSGVVDKFMQFVHTALHTPKSSKN